MYMIIVVTLRLMGKRQIGELEPSELVVAILISDLAAVPMQDIGIPLLSGILPIVTLLALELIASELSVRSLRFRAFLCGKPAFIIRDGVVDQKSMEKNRLTIDELNCCLRQQGILDIQQVQFAVLETSGQLSAFLYPKYAPLTAQADNKHPKAPEYPVTVVSDGRILQENLKSIGKDEGWLEEIFREKGLELRKVFLMTGTERGETFVVEKEETR